MIQKKTSLSTQWKLKVAIAARTQELTPENVCFNFQDKDNKTCCTISETSTFPVVLIYAFILLWFLDLFQHSVVNSDDVKYTSNLKDHSIQWHLRKHPNVEVQLSRYLGKFFSHIWKYEFLIVKITVHPRTSLIT